jgi:hypothetical protein
MVGHTGLVARSLGIKNAPNTWCAVKYHILKKNVWPQPSSSTLSAIGGKMTQKPIVLVASFLGMANV